MGICVWDLEGSFSTSLPVHTPRLTVRCEYPDMREHEEFEVETDESPVPFSSETVRRVVVE